MKKRTLWILLLCMCMIVVSGCSETPPDQTTLPATLPVTVVTATPDPVELYTKAIEGLGTEAVGMNVEVSQTVTIGGQEFHSSSEQLLGFWNIGTDNFIGHAEDNTDLIEHSFTVDELYTGGNLYLEVNDCLFTSPLEAEDFLVRRPGVQMLDSSLYTLTLSDDQTTILFTDAAAVETWLAGEDATVNQAEASLTLDENGIAKALDYAITYEYGNASFDVTYHVTYCNPGVAPALPEDSAAYTAVKDVDGMWLPEIAFGYLLQAKQYTAQSISSMQSQAAGMMVNCQYSLNSYAANSKIDYHLESNVYLVDSSGTQEQKTVEKFIDGKYTISIDDGKEQPNSAVSSQVMQTATTDILIGNIMDTRFLTDAEITNLGSLFLIEYTPTDEMADAIQSNLCETYFGDPEILDNMATAYSTNAMEYYLALDAYTLLPTACGYRYEGCHTINGYDCLLTDQLDISYDLASLTSYKAIYSAPSPDTEPEERPTPLFYHVTGSDGQEMWLFGTIHVGDDRTAFLPQKIYDALLSSTALAVECDTEGFDAQLEKDDELASQVSNHYYYTDGTISDHLDTEDLYEYAKKVLKATGGYFFNSEYQKSSVWSNNISNYYLDQGHKLLDDKGVEKRLEKIAEDNNIPLWEVESSLFQIEMLFGYSDHLQEFLLYNDAYSHGKEVWQETQELYELWCAGDEAALIEQMARESWNITEEDLAEWESEEDLEADELEKIQQIRKDLNTINAELKKIHMEYITAMEIDRNKGMLNKAIEYLESGDTVFYAVGLAHLLAEDGLLFTLRDAGYTVELVSFE